MSRSSGGRSHRGESAAWTHGNIRPSQIP
jgi:hypothetical protein